MLIVDRDDQPLAAVARRPVARLGAAPPEATAAAAGRQMPVHEVRDDDGEIVLEHAREAAPVRRPQPLERAVQIEREGRAPALDRGDDRRRGDSCYELPGGLQ